MVMTIAARSNDLTKASSLEQTGAFDRAYAATYYQFDACGDELAGRTYRRALAERFAQCPFSAAAKARLRTRSLAQRQKSNDLITKLIEENGGLPVHLDSMTRICQQQRYSDEYRTVRERLESYSAGMSAAESVVAAPCTAETITP